MTDLLLLIRDGAMPKSCCVCRLCADGWCYALDDHIARLFDRPDRCPLVELPDHGRLIDADALVTMAREYGYELVSVDRIIAAQTIIPASKEGDNG